MSPREEFIQFLRSIPDQDFRPKEGDNLRVESGRRRLRHSSNNDRARCRKMYRRKKVGEIKAARAVAKAKKVRSSS